MNNQQLPTQAGQAQAEQWFQLWSQYMIHNSQGSLIDTELAQSTMQQVLDATTQGDSCIAASQAQLQSLQHLLQPAALALNVVAPFVSQDQRLYLYRYWQLEQSVAVHVARLKSQQLHQIDLAARYTDLLQDPEQKQTLSMVANHALSIITGGPGTGKTYTLAHIIAVLNDVMPNIRIAMAAPTGKAAQRMKEALQNALNSDALKPFDLEALKRLQPVTLHRLLGLGMTAQPRFHEKQPLPYDVIVVDEASMLDLNLAQMLLAAVPENCRLILLGDANQLASVDVGMVLADLQQVNALSDNRVNLRKSRRFKDGALIGIMAQFIQQPHQDNNVLADFERDVVAASQIQAVPLTTDMADVLQLQYLPDADEPSIPSTGWDSYYDQLMLGYQGFARAIKHSLGKIATAEQLDEIVGIFDDYRILSAIRHGDLGLTKLNTQIEQRLLKATGQIKQGDWYVGRPVMMTYNDYQLGLSNGDIGLCLQRESAGRLQFEVYFPSLEKWVPATRLPKRIETAFALTIHKSQGSEFTHTAVVLDRYAKNLLSKELIYTAITRAKKVVSLLVDREAFDQSLKVKTTRMSGLLDQVNNQLDCKV